MTITGIAVREMLTPASCPAYVNNGSDLITNPIRVRSGGTFEIKADCGNPLSGRVVSKNQDDRYEVEISITYTTVMGGQINNYTETGLLRGNAE